MEKSNFNDLINQAKSKNNTKVIQKITPIKVKQNNEIQFSFYLEKQLLKQLKLKAVELDISIKKIINRSIADFLDKGKEF